MSQKRKIKRTQARKTTVITPNGEIYGVDPANVEQARKIKVRTQDGEILYVDRADLNEGPLQHTTLPTQLTVRITVLHQHPFVKAMFDSSMTLERWFEGFLRDIHPENEVRCWELMCQTYTSFDESRDLSLDARQEARGLVLAMGNGQDLRGPLWLSRSDYNDLLKLGRETLVV